MLVIIGMAIFFLLISLLNIKILKKLFNPVTMFCGLWAVIVFLSGLQLYDLKKSSYWTYICIWIGIFFYVVGFYFEYQKTFKLRIGSKGYVSKVTNLYGYRPNYTVIYPLIGLLFLTKLLSAKTGILALLSGGDLNEVLFLTRASSSNARRTIMNVVHNLVTGPFEFAIYPICAYNLFNKKHKMLSGVILGILLLGIVSTGGRVNLIYLMICSCVVFTFSKDSVLTKYVEQMKVMKKSKYHFIIIGIAFLISFVIVSISRSGSKLFQHIYLYFAMQPTMFETWSNIVKKEGLLGFGEASFNGFTFHILYVLKNVFGLSYPQHWYDVFNMILRVDSDWKPITNAGLPANAYVSAFWYFYLDGREVGIVIFSFLFGIISSHYFKKTVRKPDMRNICIYAMILFGIIDTYVRMRFAVSDYVGGFLILNYLLFKKYKIFDSSLSYKTQREKNNEKGIYNNSCI